MFFLKGRKCDKNNSLAAKALNSKDLHVAPDSARSFLFHSGKSLQSKVISPGVQLKKLYTDKLQKYDIHGFLILPCE